MFDRLIKRKDINARRDPVCGKKDEEEDDFFKEGKEETTPPEEIKDPDKLLTEDLKAFQDDFKKGKKKEIKEEKTEFAEMVGNKEEEKTKVEEIKADEGSEENWRIRKRNNNIDDGWLNKDYEDGELAVDVYQDKDNVYVRSTIAGVSVDDIDISIHNDFLTIRGKREKTKDMEGVDYFYQECYWGSFSRSIILPVEVKADKIDAFLKDGILTIVLPKVKKASMPKIKVKEK